MSASVPETLPRHLQLTDFDVALERGSTGRMQPVVQGLRVHLTPEGLRVLTRGLIDEADRRAPVTLWLEGVRVGPAGIDLELRVEKSFFRGDFAIRLALSAPDGNFLRVEVVEVDVPAWMPLDLLLEEAAKRGGAAVRRDPANRRALLLDPAALLTRFGVPGRFAPGRWDVSTGAEGIALTFRETPPSSGGGDGGEQGPPSSGDSPPGRETPPPTGGGSGGGQPGGGTGLGGEPAGA